MTEQSWGPFSNRMCVEGISTRAPRLRLSVRGRHFRLAWCRSVPEVSYRPCCRIHTDSARLGYSCSKHRLPAYSADMLVIGCWQQQLQSVPAYCALLCGAPAEGTSVIPAAPRHKAVCVPGAQCRNCECRMRHISSRSRQLTAEGFGICNNRGQLHPQQQRTSNGND
jgi:hypothetical protein